jgi:L-tyrosine peroxygenase
MNTSSAPIVRDLPLPAGWDFGGFPYGLEPLTLPAPASPGETRDEASAEGACSPYTFEKACLGLLCVDPRNGVTDGELTQGPELFWFRWITGHQVSFIIWQLMARAIQKNARGEGQRTDVTQELSHYIRGYCAMLLYTSSCPRDVYETVIRPSMYRHHRAFSGSWAPDFHPVRDLFRGRRLQPIDTRQPTLSRSIWLYQQIHSGVAGKLVRDGRSLLQASGREAVAQDKRVLSVIYDSYFMTLRAPVSFSDVVAQLLRRLNAIALDIAANGLHPVNASHETETAAELLLDEVLELERELTWVNFRVASLAAGFTDYPCLSERSASAGPTPSGRPIAVGEVQQQEVAGS